MNPPMTGAATRGQPRPASRDRASGDRAKPRTEAASGGTQPARTQPARDRPARALSRRSRTRGSLWPTSGPLPGLELRTALALVAAGLGIVQLLPPFPGVPLGRHLVGVPLIVLGAVLAIAAYTDMMRNQRALRRGEPLPRSVLPRLLAGTVGAVATLAAIVVLLSATR